MKLVSRFAFAVALFLTFPTLAPSSPLEGWEVGEICVLERQNAGISMRSDAELTLVADETDIKVSFLGTHQDPIGIDRRPIEERTYTLVQKPRYLDAWVFQDDSTLGVLSFSYSGKTMLSVHVQGSDHAYAELFVGHCREPK